MAQRISVMMEESSASRSTSYTEPEAEPIAENIEEEPEENRKYQDFVEAFGLYDEENTGFIGPGHLFIGTGSIGLNLTEAEVQDLIATVDVDGSERIVFEELAKLILEQPEAEGEAKAVFALFDQDRNGVIGIEDLSSVTAQLGFDLTPDQLTLILDAADVDKDGAVTYNDLESVFEMTVDEAKVYIRDLAIAQEEQTE